MEAFKASFARKVSIHFLGLFDTVSSVGWVYDPLIVPYTRRNEDVKIIRHAVSLDERRSFFRQNLWTEGQGVNLKQVWFAGVHADVGGGYPAGESQLALIALRWMVGECLEAGLSIDVEACRAQLYPASSVLQDPLAQAHDSLTRNWLIAEWVPRLVWNPKTHKRVREYGSMPPFGKPRSREILTDKPGQKVRVHDSVAVRLKGSLADDQPWGSQLTYQPENLLRIDAALIEQVGDSPRLDEYNL
ncbi:DUF2235 domain-containing protein [Pseudomonas chlororaphis]|uniref:phospholipase effector Tle1 domain-containing protein n=2 Tax=Pseudomonas TaxID=286 RepID=UPI0034629DB5